MRKIFYLVLVAVCVVVFVFLRENDFVLASRTPDGLVLGRPSYEKRSQNVSETDLDVILEAKSLLSGPELWAKNSTRECPGNPPYSLFCALEAASVKVTGNYVHRRPALQEVRFAIDDLFHNRWKLHRFADFNSNPLTTHADILDVLSVGEARIRKKLAR